MSKHFDKLLLCGAVVACAAGIGFYVMKKDDTSAVKSAYIGQSPTGNSYEAIPLPPVSEESLQWTPFVRPEDDDLEDWKYDLFTPIEVSWHNSAGEYRPKGEALVVHDFGVQLVSISRPVYRLMLHGYLAPPPPKPFSDTIIRIHDSQYIDPNGGKEPGKTFRVKKGDTIKEENVVVTDFELKRIEMPDGTRPERAVVTVHDNVLNRDFVLTEYVPYEFEDEINIIVAKTSDPSVTWTLRKVGDQIKDEELGTFTLKEIDFGSKSINLDKLYKPNPRKSPKTESKTLTLESSGSSTSSPTSGTTNTRP
ncbi:MAG: hypothetical protein LBV12_01975 [Puniceicoccales bacterium]|jgi:hypothetical protein|nr:hypothetical protein [Puniceicoccales bacterium]